MSEAEYLAGRLLLAMPGMGDARFARSVIAMCLHDDGGAFGLALGQPHARLRFRALLADVGVEPGAAPDRAVLAGGPVEPGRGFVLHSQDWRGPGTVAVPSFGALSSSMEVLKAIAAGTGPARWVFALGYAGWGAGQLEGEMRRHGWFAARGNADVAFDIEPPARWAATWRAEGIDPALLANATGSA